MGETCMRREMRGNMGEGKEQDLLQVTTGPRNLCAGRSNNGTKRQISKER